MGRQRGGLYGALGFLFCGAAFALHADRSQSSVGPQPPPGVRPLRGKPHSGRIGKGGAGGCHPAGPGIFAAGHLWPGDLADPVHIGFGCRPHRHPLAAPQSAVSGRPARFCRSPENSAGRHGRPAVPPGFSFIPPFSLRVSARARWANYKRR